jgi:hypothetical protein
VRLVQAARSSVEPVPPAAVAEPPSGLPCPSCGALLNPPPVRDRRCPRCRQPIVARHLDGRLVLLTEAAVTVFESERHRTVEERMLTGARQRWLRLARKANASPARRAKLAAAPVSFEVVDASRRLYLATAERAVKAARHDGRWGDVGRIRREQAKALFEEAGSQVPPADAVAGLQREGMIAVLRSMRPLARAAELVSAGCCPACRADDGKTFEITAEIRAARLPHAGCPRGLCRCDWWPATVEPKRPRRRPRAAESGG